MDSHSRFRVCNPHSLLCPMCLTPKVNSIGDDSSDQQALCRRVHPPNKLASAKLPCLVFGA